MKSLLVLSLFFLSTTASAVTYNLQVLQSLSGTGDSTALALNDNGTVVGNSYNSETAQLESVYWSGGSVTSLGVTGTARGINNSDTIVGETGNLGTAFPVDSQAYSYTATGGVAYLGTLGGSNAAAHAINSSGVITGYAYPTGGNLLQSQAFIYQNGAMTSLGTVSSPTGYSRGHGINDAGEIVGRASAINFGGSEKHLTYWDASGNLNFYNSTSGNYSTGQQINNHGTIVGNGREAATGNTQFGMVWDVNGSLLNVFDSFGGTGNLGSRAWSLNDAGVIVGYGVDASSAKRASVSYDGVNMIDINTLVDLTGTGFISLDEAYDINASGQIVGVGTRSDGSAGAFMLTAVPVPAAIWLFGSALAGLAWLRRKAIV